MSKNLESYKTTYAYNSLIEKYSLSDYGIWNVRGEDPNCDLGGSHHMPDLGTYEGRLEDILTMAVELPSFWGWGAGGEIVAVTIKTINIVTNKEKAQLMAKQAELTEELEKINKRLKEL